MKASNPLHFTYSYPYGRGIDGPQPTAFTVGIKTIIGPLPVKFAQTLAEFRIEQIG